MEKDNTVWFWVLIGMVVLVFVLGTLGMGSYGMMMGVGMGFGFLLMLLFLVAVIWLIVTLASGKGIREEESDALAILKKRYARGEISKEEFEEMKNDLK